jgi:RNA polymerase sigma-70 factor (ECF subfamily)
VGELISDAEARRASLDDPERFEVIFDRHFGAIHRFVGRRLGRELAEEIAAEVFVTAFASRSRYDTARENARPWLLGIASNLIRHQRRGEVRRLRAYVRTGADPDDQPHDAELFDRVDAQAARAQLAEGIASLSAEDREVLLLYAWADLTYPEIAEALAIPLGTVRSRLFRARRQFRELLGASGQFEDEELERTTPHG